MEVLQLTARRSEILIDTQHMFTSRLRVLRKTITQVAEAIKIEGDSEYVH